ncbi:hypothetical protein B9Q01_02395 [Candidatus Marsarchaeota G1 archaeon OSP_D]|jgi:uncharacterized membrane protein YfcA|uniref:Probable membrane transporter protein n=2 Tax=Candidatus Marsarchaeota group 1 TaxID=2203770 RepID=A0A2R6ACM7_9ARCH|nr:MAG: hypothetical protein B9Q01_02395 [Candidatus Marsarchaeota G1 archaeon OSP_D]PSN87112.1 MAG: hypothetical protein B9Q00_09730 [Candidatus Marsarchaeota G1 archaeon OSP_C]
MFPAPSALQALLAILSGFLVGFSLGLIGGGGSILAVPLLLYLVGYSKYPHLVIGTTAFAVGVNAYINLFQHMRHKTVKLKPGLVFALIGALGDYIGATLGLITPGKTLLLLFGVLMIIVALLMLRNNTATSQRQSTSWTRLTVTAFLVGIAAGYFGIGGGFLIVPGLMFSTSISIVEAISTSLLSVGTFGVVAALRYFLAGEVDFLIAALYLVGGVLGGYFGTKIEHSVPKRTLKLIFSAIVIVVALYLIYSNI